MREYPRPDTLLLYPWFSAKWTEWGKYISSLLLYGHCAVKGNVWFLWASEKNRKEQRLLSAYMYIYINIHTYARRGTSNLGKASEASWTLFYTGKLFPGLCSNVWLYSTTSCLLCAMQLCLNVDHPLKSSWNHAQDNDCTESDRGTIKPRILYLSAVCALEKQNGKVIGNSDFRNKVGPSPRYTSRRLVVQQVS